MTIERKTHTQGAEALLVLCATCTSRLGGLLLFALHKGYGERAIPLTAEELTRAEEVALSHDLSHHRTHNIRIMQFRSK